MSLVNAKCPNCGQSLKVDSAKDAAICEFCGSAFIVEKAIQNFNINNTVNVGAGAVVNVYSNVSDDFVIEARELKKYRGVAADVVIPNTVKIIGEHAFEGLSVTSVTIPNSVTSIGFQAFCNCRKLTSITIPDSVTSIAARAFLGCNGLKTAGPIGSGSDYQFSWKTAIPDHAFDGSGLTSITIPNTVESIGSHAFGGCESLASIAIPNSVIRIGGGAFCDCSGLTSVSIPDSVTNIGSYAFARCNNLKRVNITDLSMWCKITFEEDALSNPLSNSANLYIDNKIVTNIEIPDSVTCIGACAFTGCCGLESIIIPNSVLGIGNLAFKECSGLTSVTIPDSVTSIGRSAFLGCRSLTHIVANKEIKRRVKETMGITGTTSSSVGCYVATAVYGSYDCPQVWTLRRYRDYSLAPTWYGRLFIALYYAISPTIVKWFGNTDWFNKMWKGRLDKMVKRLQEEGFENTPYEDKNW